MTDGLSIFGDLDVTNMNDDPFYVAPDTYKVMCTEAVWRETKDGGKALSITYLISQPGGEFDGKRLQDFFPMPQLNGRTKMEELDPDERNQIARMRRRIRTGWDIPEEELNSVQVSTLVNQVLYLTVAEKKDKEDPTKTFTNIVKSESEAAFNERASEVGTSAFDL